MCQINYWVKPMEVVPSTSDLVELISWLDGMDLLLKNEVDPLEPMWVIECLKGKFKISVSLHTIDEFKKLVSDFENFFQKLTEIHSYEFELSVQENMCRIDAPTDPDLMARILRYLDPVLA